MGVPGGASAIRLSTLEAQVAEHNKADDCWSVYRGKVYDTTAFHEYHPGGVKYMLAAAGKDGTKLFDKFHRCGAAGRRGGVARVRSRESSPPQPRHQYAPMWLSGRCASSVS